MFTDSSAEDSSDTSVQLYKAECERLGIQPSAIIISSLPSKHLKLAHTWIKGKAMDALCVALHVRINV